MLTLFHIRLITKITWSGKTVFENDLVSWQGLFLWPFCVLLSLRLGHNGLNNPSLIPDLTTAQHATSINEQKLKLVFEQWYLFLTSIWANSWWNFIMVYKCSIKSHTSLKVHQESTFLINFQIWFLGAGAFFSYHVRLVYLRRELDHLRYVRV